MLNGPVQNAFFAEWTGTGIFAFSSLQGTAVPKGWNSQLPTWEPQVTIARNCRLPEVGTGSQPGKTMGRNCRFPEVGTPGSQLRNHGLPLQRTSSSQMLKLTVANVGTTGYHCKELPVLRGWNSSFPIWGQRLPLQASDSSQRLELLVPNFGNHGLPLQAIGASQK